MTRVKVCGLTREEDVRLAVRLGVWACGLVLSESPRRVTLERARRLAREAGSTLTVAVVTTQSARWIADALAFAGLKAVQLSGGADGPTVAAMRAGGGGGGGGRWPRGGRPPSPPPADTPDAAAADFVLLDARAPGRYGGTGQTLDWAALAADRRVDRERLVLAGGLTPDNVAEAVAALQPLAVDVASGVESCPGHKDPDLVARFFAAVSSSPALPRPGGRPMTSSSSAPEVAP